MTRLAIGLFVILGILGVGGGAHVEAQTSPADTAPGAGKDPATPASDVPGTAPAEGLDVKLDDNVTPQGPRKPNWDDIVVVPRKAFLKGGRLELSPFSGMSINDVLIRHYSFGGDLNYYLTDVFSVGLQGQYFIKELTTRESLVGLQYNRVPTLNRFKYGAALNFGYVPGYGKFTLFNKYIFHWDVFVSAGVGIIRTEIIPRVLGDLTWENNNIAPDFGLGARLFLNDWITASLSVRDYVFNDKFEPTNRERGEAVESVKSRASSQLINNVMVFASVSFYLPTSFQYRTPR